MAGQRRERLREEMKKEASDILRRLKDPRIGFVTVTDVELTRDLRHAKIFVSVYGDAEAQEETMGVLERAKGFFRTEIGQRIRMRFTPEIHFVLDSSIERGARIVQLLKEVQPDASEEEGKA